MCGESLCIFWYFHLGIGLRLGTCPLFFIMGSCDKGKAKRGGLAEKLNFLCTDLHVPCLLFPIGEFLLNNAADGVFIGPNPHNNRVKISAIRNVLPMIGCSANRIDNAGKYDCLSKAPPRAPN
jgi:hypothetical protein